MRVTRKKAPTSSLIERIAKNLNAVLAGPLAPRSLRQVQQLVADVRSLYRENRRLTSSNEQLVKLRSEALKDLLACQLQLQLLDKQLQATQAMLELRRELLVPRKRNPWDNSCKPRRKRKAPTLMQSLVG